jgi:RNA polymerase-associated protein
MPATRWTVPVCACSCSTSKGTVRARERLEERNVKGNEKALEKARAHIRDRLTQMAPIFLKNKYMLGENFSMLDVAIAPLLWRLDYYGIELSKNAAPLLKYAERIFSRPAYIEALTPSEKVMRK